MNVNKAYAWICLLVLGTFFDSVVYSQPDQSTERKTNWNGYEQFHFKIANRAAYIVAPKKPADNNPWVWRARVSYCLCRCGRLVRQPGSVAIGNEFYDHLVTRHNLNPKPALEGVSRGGDDQRSKLKFSYDEVLATYTKWLVSHREQDWYVLDLHTEMNSELAERRKSSPEFTFQPDSVHPNEAGHWYIASRLIDWFGDAGAANSESPTQMLIRSNLDEEIFPKIKQRMALLRDAYLTKTKHARPGINAGLPLEKAHQKVKELSNQIRELLK